MRILNTLISCKGMGKINCNPDRLVLLGKLANIASHEKAKLLIVPAGFLTANSNQHRDELLDQVVRLAKEKGINIIGGIDLVSNHKKNTKINKKKLDEMVSKSSIPYFGFAINGSGLIGTWQQRSTTAANSKLVLESNINNRDRIIEIKGFRVGVLICGEIFSPRIRTNMSDLKLKPHLIVNIGHAGMTRFIPTIRNISKMSGCSVVHNHHIKDWHRRSFHFVDANSCYCPQTIDRGCLKEYKSLWGVWSIMDTKELKSLGGKIL